MSDRHFHYIVPVWGKEYTEMFANICLPMILTAGNLKSPKRNDRDRFVIVTTGSDAEYLSEHAHIKELGEYISIEYILIDGRIELADTHGAMSQCYVLAMQSPKVVYGETYFVFLTPDSFWSENCFERLREIADEGYKVAMVMGLRTRSETIVPYLSHHIATASKDASIPMDQLVTLALNHLHNMSEAHNWFAPDGFLNSWPSHIYWLNKNRALLAHCFHHHPLMVQSKQGTTEFKETIDGDYLDKLKFPLNKYYVAGSNDDFIGIEISSSERSWGQEMSKPSLSRIRTFGLFFVSRRHWHFFKHPIKYTGVGYQETAVDQGIAGLSAYIVSETLKSKNGSVLISGLRLKRPLTKIANVLRGTRLHSPVRRLMSTAGRIMGLRSK